ncbi:hypothetical protein J4470_05550 [Candidatus Woesearchaeota archaeon]|nr:hypothetical protein [Candidatus Woesearchaeota archaeon]
MKKKTAKADVADVKKAAKIASVKAEGKKPSMALAVASLIINAFLLPGLGTSLGGKTKQGILQLVIFVGGFLIGIFATLMAVLTMAVSSISGIILAFLAISGGAMMLAGWIWAIISGAMLVREASL